MSVEFFESSFTFANESSIVTCCHSNNLTIGQVTCGLGSSCAGQCSAIGASLCPSGVCTEKYKDCEIDMDVWSESRGQSSVTGSAASFRWCYPACNVEKHQGCCHNPNCFKEHKELCKWKSFMTGMNHFDIWGAVLLWGTHDFIETKRPIGGLKKSLRPQMGLFVSIKSPSLAICALGPNKFGGLWPYV